MDTLGGGFEPWLIFPSMGAPQYEDVVGINWLWENGFSSSLIDGNHFDLGGWSKLRYFVLPIMLSTRFRTKVIPGDRLFQLKFAPEIFCMSLFLPVGVQEFWLTQTLVEPRQRKVAR